MKDPNWVNMIKSMQEIRFFSRNLILRNKKEYEIPAQHLDLLSQLAISKRKMTPMELSDYMGLDKAIISRVIEKLNKSGYLVKEKDEIDKRRCYVYITDAGKKKIEDIYKYYLSPIYQLYNNLGDKDFENLMKYIEKANTYYHKDKETKE